MVHEVWLKLIGQQSRRWHNRHHFFAAAAEAMRRILTDIARRKLRIRHGGGKQRVELDENCAVATIAEDEHVIAVSDALVKFARLDPQRAELVKLRHFVGLTLAEAAEVMGISEATAKRYWSFARAWLHEEIRGQST